jgi:hypothetical protein
MILISLFRSDNETIETMYLQRKLLLPKLIILQLLPLTLSKTKSEMNKNIIAFNKNGISLKTMKVGSNRDYVLTIQSELMQFGYMMTDECMEQMYKVRIEDLTTWSKEIFKYLKDILGDGDYKTIHQGFPDTVLEMSEPELFMTRMIEYWTNAKPVQIPNSSETYQWSKFTELNWMKAKDFNKIFTALAGTPVALSPTDNEVFEWFLKNYEKHILNSLMPDKIPFKEMMGRLAGNKLKLPVKTPTDVMRIAAYLSYGDTDINTPVKTVRKSQWDRS